MFSVGHSLETSEFSKKGLMNSDNHRFQGHRWAAPSKPEDGDAARTVEENVGQNWIDDRQSLDVN